MGIGDTFLLSAPALRVHLFMILTNPDSHDRVVLTNFSTSRPSSDKSCVVSPTEHPWLSRESIVSFQDARIRTIGELEAADKMGVLRHNSPLSGRLLSRIRHAALKSNRCPRKVKAAIQADMVA